jgi:hypothetical protein
MNDNKSASRVTIHMAASLDGFIARRDGRVDWLETSDEFPGGDTMDPEFVAAFLKTIDCYVMGSRTYETALRFESRGFGWAYGDKPVFVLTTRALPRTRVSFDLVRRRRRACWRMPSPRIGRRRALLDPADLDRRRNLILREARSRHRAASRGSEGVQERHGRASLRSARTKLTSARPSLSRSRRI